MFYNNYARFEKYGTDKRRTLLNIFVSMYCWAVLEFLAFVQLPETIRYIYGPLPEIVCHMQYIIRHSILTVFLMLKDASVMTRYAFIFWLKNPVAFNDEFWSLFLWLWIHGMAILFQGSAYFLATYPPVQVFICAGTDPTGTEKFFEILWNC